MARVIKKLDFWVMRYSFVAVYNLSVSCQSLFITAPSKPQAPISYEFKDKDMGNLIAYARFKVYIQDFRAS